MIRKEILAKGVALLAVLFLVSVPTVLAQDFCEADMNYDGYVQFNDLKIIKAEYNRDDCPPDGPAPVPKTGQKPYYSPRDDGYYKTGVPWPNPRFTPNVDNNGDNDCVDIGEYCDETVTDNLTGLMWLWNANCMMLNTDLMTEYDTDGDPNGAVTWQHALDFIDAINQGLPFTEFCSGGYNDWRLPNAKELQSLISFGNQSPALSDTAGPGHWSDNDPFVNLEFVFPAAYWSSTTGNFDADYAWNMYFGDGDLWYSPKANYMYVWPVRGGHTQPRFTDNGDGTVTDNLPGLVWLKNAGCFGYPVWNDAMSQAASLADGTCNLTDGSSPGDWRLPMKTEWEDFYCPQYTEPAVCNTAGTGQWTAGDPFDNVGSTSLYWSRTEGDPGWAWCMDMKSYGQIYQYLKTASLSFWAVRAP